MSKRKEWRETVFEPRMQIRHSSILFFDQYADKMTHKRSMFTKKTYSGEMTNGASKRIRKAVDILLQLSPQRQVFNPILQVSHTHTLSFITLTIPGSERRIKPIEANPLLLEKWLRIMKEKHNMNTYVWKAEYQKNGQLHYHITTPSWIHYLEIKNTWNDILYSNGMLTEWSKVNPNKSPNSTDVHAVYKAKNMQAYLTKYLQKDVHGRDKKEVDKFKENLSEDELYFFEKERHGKIWDCSMFLKKAKHFSIQEPSLIRNIVDRKDVQIFNHVGIFYTTQKDKVLPQYIMDQYKKHIAEITNKQLF